MTIEIYCTPESPCNLDSKPMIIPSVHHGTYRVACNFCASTWWTYQTPRSQIIPTPK